jgi:plasmid stability protein
MRTTLDLPDELLKRAKIAAARRGMTLQALVGSVLAEYLAAETTPAPAGPKIKFPLFSSARPGSLDLTNTDLARAEASEDLRRLGLSR